jgi:hypothetical protein
MSTQQIVNIGTLPNDGEGDPLRVAFAKINNNFSNLFPTAINTSNAVSNGNAANQVIFQTAANTFTMGQLYVYSADPAGNSSQTIQLNVQLNQELTNVKFTAFGTSFINNPLTNYDMRVLSGNVQLLVSPLANTTMFHFIGSQVQWAGANIF